MPFLEQELTTICLNAFSCKTCMLYNVIHKGKHLTSLQELHEGIKTVQPLLDKKTAATAPTNNNKQVTDGDKGSGKRCSSGGDKNTCGGKRRNNQNMKLFLECWEELGASCATTIPWTVKSGSKTEIPTQILVSIISSKIGPGPQMLFFLPMQLLQLQLLGSLLCIRK